MARASARESVAKVKYFQCKHWLLTSLRHRDIGLQTWCIMGYVQKVYFLALLYLSFLEYFNINVPDFSYLSADIVPW